MCEQFSASELYLKASAAGILLRGGFKQLESWQTGWYSGEGPLFWRMPSDPGLYRAATRTDAPALSCRAMSS